MAKAPLSRPEIESQLDQIDLLRAMYPSAEELSVDAETESTLSTLRNWCEGSSSETPAIPHAVSLTVILPLEEDRREAHEISLSVDMILTPERRLIEPSLKVRVRQPDWLTKAETANLAAGLPEDDVLAAIEHVREQGDAFLLGSKVSVASKLGPSIAPLVRVWFYFPSISTRDKRDDIIAYAPGHNLTGFLVAGKPGILCLEGSSEDVDNYMRFIKTESWRDIPSGHKKVSERLRESGPDIVRVFSGMEEITDRLEKRGEKSNRSNMTALELWLSEKGMSSMLSKVLM